MRSMTLIATAAFGLESVVKREVTDLGFDDIKCIDSRVEFASGNIHEAIVRSNLWLRSADRVLLKMAEFKATDFETLFEQTKALPWDDWITKDGKFTVTAKTHKSGLSSEPAIQKIVKKAVADRLQQKYKVNWFDETGPEYTIQAAFLKDIVTLTIDTTGVRNGLHKRGYRAKSNDAPIKETMAAALISLSRWNGRHGKKTFLDPCCGSGTLPIEAAMLARNIAPGLARKSACEFWPQIDAKLWKDARMDAYAQINHEIEPEIYASDIDPKAIELAQANAELAGVDDCIIFENKPVKELRLPASTGVAIINPPYGERLGAIKEAEALYADLGNLFNPSKWNVYVITPDEFFETSYKRKAKAKRKLFNGMIKTDYYQYF